MPVGSLDNQPKHLGLEPTALFADPSTSLDRLIAAQVNFLDYKNLDWSRVVRTQFFAYERFQYVYPSLVLDLSQRLMIKPPARHGNQRRLDFKITVEPVALSLREHTDQFKNQVIELEIARINDWTAFEVMFCVERDRRKPVSGPREGEMTNLLAKATRLTAANPRLLEVAKALSARAATPLELAERICDWVSDNMRYRSGVTGVRTTAAEALETGAGLCQDYAHVAISLCRAAGLAARYVSGHMLGEGGSHAWLEAIIPDQNGGLQAVGFDPTNARRPNLGYTIVGLGRDYGDVPPTSGRFVGQSGGTLHFEKYSGLIEVEFDDGQIWR